MHLTIALIASLALIVAVILNRWLQGTFVGRALLYLDIFVCSLLLSDPDTTISARCGLALRYGRGGLLAGLGRLLNVLQANHCENAIADDIARARAAIERLTGVDPVYGPTSYDDCQ